MDLTGLTDLGVDELLDLEPPHAILVFTTNEGYGVSVDGLGRTLSLGHFPYTIYAVAVAFAVADALDIDRSTVRSL